MKSLKAAARILLVDDQPQIVCVLRTSLSTQGYSLRLAANGVEALESIVDWPPDLVITDLAMPQIDGVALTRELRSLLQVPIIVLSVSNQEALKIEALDAGTDDYITKPFSVQELLARAHLRCREASTPEVPPFLALGDFVIDIASTASACAARMSTSPPSSSTYSSA